jgi:pimeloyl-ACP methyl ester carboxylesterase
MTTTRRDFLLNGTLAGTAVLASIPASAQTTATPQVTNGAPPVTENVTKTDRHTSFYLAAGPASATPIIFVHGWPELSYSWRHQLPVMAGLGFRAIAPDMRGYGRSSIYTRQSDYAHEYAVDDMIELLNSFGGEKAIWVGHDWGAPVVFALAQHYPERCHGVAALCIPYLPDGFTTEHAIALADRNIYPEDKFPAAQWDYMLFYHGNFALAQAQYEKNVRATLRGFFRAGNPAGRGRPARTSMVRANGGLFGPSVPLDIPTDTAIVTEEDENTYVAGLERNGFFGPISWYMNDSANAAYAERAKSNWRLTMPVLFVHGAYDYGAQTLDSSLATPMRANCANLTEATVFSGHWMAQEKPLPLNAALAKWMAVQFPTLWPTP